MREISADEKASFEALLQEYDGLTNEQAYVNSFSKRMLAPIPRRPGEFFGCDQRLDMLPSLQRLVATVPAYGEVLDVGAGAGEIVDFALKNVPKGATIHIEEPNSLLINTYVHRLKTHHLNVGAVFKGTLQDYMQEKNRSLIPQKPQHLIIAIHMLYHLTDFTSRHIDPTSDLIEAFAFLYNLLDQGGSIFIVYADLLSRADHEAIGSLGRYYFKQFYPKTPWADHLEMLYSARNQLLGPQGTLPAILKRRYPHTEPILHSERHPTHFFGKSIADLAALGVIGELCPANDDLFDSNKLRFCFDYLTRYPERVGLQKEQHSIPQKGMWRANQPQVLATLTKSATTHPQGDFT